MRSFCALDRLGRPGHRGAQDSKRDHHTTTTTIFVMGPGIRFTSGRESTPAIIFRGQAALKAPALTNRWRLLRRCSSERMMLRLTRDQYGSLLINFRLFQPKQRQKERLSGTK
ncbi:unnamed protein product [Durusdinium trenchii]|uniref:Uncharacterized protein n=1 Tax=Durusdinium trenchii TaxID=1381693 RepID=A0ABP0NGB7_9DINO